MSILTCLCALDPWQPFHRMQCLCRTSLQNFLEFGGMATLKDAETILAATLLRRSQCVVATGTQDNMESVLDRPPSNIRALIIRIGFWGPLYHNYNQEPPK